MDSIHKAKKTIVKHYLDALAGEGKSSRVSRTIEVHMSECLLQEGQGHKREQEPSYFQINDVNSKHRSPQALSLWTNCRVRCPCGSAPAGTGRPICKESVPRSGREYG